MQYGFFLLGEDVKEMMDWTCIRWGAWKEDKENEECE